jgi:hypothetical protein
MNSDNFNNESISLSKKMLLEKRIKEMQKTVRECPYYKNKLNNINPAQAIFRIEPFNYFLNNLIMKQLYFAWPGKWGDMFDGAFVRTPVYFEKENILANEQSYNRDYFCQCWSCEELDVMWKLRSLPPYKTVMFVSTVGKIMGQIWDNESCGKYVGLAEYRPIKNMRKEDFFQSEFNSSVHVFKEVGIAETFLLKPSSLRYEKEVRFIARKSAEKDQRKERPHLIVDVLDKTCGYIDKILIDPRANETFKQHVQDALKNLDLDWKVERSIKSKKSVDEANVSDFYKSSRENYGLPKRYVFNK